MKRGKTKNEGEKNDIIKWLVLIAVFMMAIIAMVTFFSVKSSEASRKEAQQRVVKIAEEYAAKVYFELEHIAGTGKTVLYYLNHYGFDDNRSIAGIAESLCESTPVYAVAYVDADGRGILSDGEEVDMGGMSYYPLMVDACRKTAEKASEADTVRTTYLYVADDEMKAGRSAILAVLSDDTQGGRKLCLYYPVEELKPLLNAGLLAGEEFCALAEADGLIMEVAGSDNEFMPGDNVWDRMGGDSETEIGQVAVRIKNGVSGSLRTESAGKPRTLAYAEVGINNWAIVLGIGQSYIDAFVSAGWRDAMKMIHQMVVVILIFSTVIVIMIIRGRITAGEKSKALEAKADTDLLTGLNNKAATERKIQEYIMHHPEDQALMFILDIDNFKKINDTMGHAFGDEVLKSLGQQIGSIFRSTDVIGRTGGDEFIVFLKYLKEDALLEKEARKLCDFFQGFQAGEYVKYSPTSSIGAAVFPKDGKDFTALYKAADSALYTAKERGKNQLVFYKDAIAGIQGKRKVEKYR